MRGEGAVGRGAPRRMHLVACHDRDVGVRLAGRSRGARQGLVARDCVGRRFRALPLFMLPKLRSRLRWPVGAHEEAYVAVAGAGLAVALIVWSLATNFTMRGDPYPLPYVPLLNPLDLAQAFVLLVLIRYWLPVRREKYRVYANLKWQAAAGVLAALGFHLAERRASADAVSTGRTCRSICDLMLESTLVQTSISIFWTVLALATMLIATRRAVAIVWITGALLLGVVVAKLFLVDLSSVGTVERIVSFVVVGLLMLVVGYFSPLPPAGRRAHEDWTDRRDMLGHPLALFALVALRLPRRASRTACAAGVAPNDFAFGMTFEASGAGGCLSGNAACRGLSQCRACRSAPTWWCSTGAARSFRTRRERLARRLLLVNSRSFPVFPVARERGAGARTSSASRSARKAATRGHSVPSRGSRPAGPDAIVATTSSTRGRSTTPLAGLQIGWPDDAPTFAGRLRVENAATISATGARVVDAAPIANLRAGDAPAHRAPDRGALFTWAKFWRLSWVGEPAPFEITSVTAEPAGDRHEIGRPSFVVEGVAGAG